jgi:hypothetical protein
MGAAGRVHEQGEGEDAHDGSEGITRRAGEKAGQVDTDDGGGPRRDERRPPRRGWPAPVLEGASLHLRRQERRQPDEAVVE